MLARCPRSAETNIDQDITNLKEKWESVKSKLNEKKVRALISVTEQRLHGSIPGLCFISSYVEYHFHDLVFHDVKNSSLSREH